VGAAYTISNSSVSHSPGGTLTYSNSESLSLLASTLSDTVNVSTGPGNLPMTLHANTGTDTFNINPSAYTASATNGDITLHGDGGAGDTINFNDQSNSANTTAVIQNNLVNRSNTPDYLYSNFESITYNAGGGSDAFLIVSTSQATPVTLHGNGGADAFHPGNAVFGSSLDQVLGAVSVFGETGTDSLQVWDNSNAAANSFTISFSSVDSATSASTTFDTIDSITVNAGSGGDSSTSR
jgi:hypothetical protein